MSPVIPFRRRSRYPRVPFALGVLAAIALGAAAIAAWMIWQRSSVSPSGQIIEVIDGDTVRFNGAVSVVGMVDRLPMMLFRGRLSGPPYRPKAFGAGRGFLVW